MSIQPGNIPVQRQILPMLVMPAVTNHVSNVVQQRACLQQHPRVRCQVMHRLQLVEQLNAQFTHVLRVLLFVSKSPGEASRPHQQLSLRHVVSVRFLARKRFARDLLQQPFAHSHAWERQRAEVHVAA